MRGVYLEGSSRRSTAKILVRLLFRKAYKYLWYDIATLVFALDVSLMLWVFFEFVTIYYFMDVRNFPEEKGFFYYGVVHGFLLVLSEWFIKRTRERVERLQEVLGLYGMEFGINMSTWLDGYNALFSTALSFYILAMILLILNVVDPKLLKAQELLQGQVLVTFLVVTYFPLSVAVWIYKKIDMYVKNFKIQKPLLIRKGDQYYN